MATSGDLERYVLRVGHAEREECIERLVAEHVAGRLSADELDRRHQAASQALTRADLERLMVDLPQPAPSLARRTSLPRAWPRVAARWLVPPSAVATIGLWTADNWVHTQEGVFLGSVLSGAAAAVTTAWAMRRPRA